MFKSCVNMIKDTIKLVLEESRLTYYLNVPKYCYYLHKNSRISKQERIKIGFIYQEPTIWYSLKPIYERACKHPDIDAYLVVIPKVVYRNYLFLKEINYKEVYSQVEGMEGNIVYTYNPDTCIWLINSELSLQYLFYSRPYELYLPSQYRASNMMKYSKICYVPYAYETLELSSCTQPVYFFRNVYMSYWEHSDTYARLKHKLNLNYMKSKQYSYLSGYPRIDLIDTIQFKEGELWKNSRSTERKRIVWTTRWTPDPKLGGSNFLRYKDVIQEYVIRNEKIDFVFRPHPFTFETFIKWGLISKIEIENYCNCYNNSPNAIVDNTKEYLDTFYSSDILIADCSSIIIDYLMTSNPVILCKASESYGEYMTEMLEAFYVVTTKEELMATVESLVSGNDEKKEVREKWRKKLKTNSSISEWILNTIKEDYYK